MGGSLHVGGSPLLQQRELEFSPAKERWILKPALAAGFFNALHP